MAKKIPIKQDSDFASSLVNAMTGTGTGADSRTSGHFALGPLLNTYEASALYMSNWMARKIVDIPAQDITRKWREVHCPSFEVETITNAEKALRLPSKILTSLKWARLYGGSLLLLGVRDGLELHEPLNPEMIGLGDLEFVQSLARTEVGISDINTWNPLSENYYDPEFYTVLGRRIHKSRVIKFTGLEPTDDQAPLCDYFGFSVLQPMYETVRDAVQALAGASNLTLKASQDVIKTSSLWDYVGTPDESKISQRFALMQAQRSILNMLVLDKEEDFESVSATYSGLDNVLNTLLNMIVGASDIPSTRFFGQSPNGFNATGESDMRNYYDKVSADQESDLRPPLEKLDDVFIRSTLGVMPDDYGFTFPSLWQPNDTELSEIEKNQIEKLKGLYELGVPDEVILKDIKEMGLSKNLTDELIEEILSDPEITENPDSAGY